MGKNTWADVIKYISIVVVIGDPVNVIIKRICKKWQLIKRNGMKGVRKKIFKN